MCAHRYQLSRRDRNGIVVLLFNASGWGTDPIELNSFLQLPVDEVEQRARASGPEVCVFPINGTRRWFMLEYGHLSPQELQDLRNFYTTRREAWRESLQAMDMLLTLTGRSEEHTSEL